MNESTNCGLYIQWNTVLKKEGMSDIRYMNKLGGHYIKWNKPVTKGQILYDSHQDYMEWGRSSFLENGKGTE